MCLFLVTPSAAELETTDASYSFASVMLAVGIRSELIRFLPKSHSVAQGSALICSLGQSLSPGEVADIPQ